MKLRVLLVNSDPEETLFLQDVLCEIQEGDSWPGYVELDCVHAPTWADAESILAGGNPNDAADLILMGLDLEDAQGAEALRYAQVAAPNLPVILLIDDADIDLAIQQIREGAQDYVLLSRLECETFAHAMRTAIERQRVVSALRASSTVDFLTNLPNAAAFLAAERERQLAVRLGCCFALVVAEPQGMPQAFGTQAGDILLVQAAEALQLIAGPATLLARISADRFGLAIVDGKESVDAELNRISTQAAASQIRIGAATMQPDRPVGLESLLDQAVRDLGAQPASASTTSPRLHSKAAAMRT
ncbi:MAG: diguanylate cyclase [Bryobacteraceae bacterium]